ncbi:MAG: hypothetical protein CR997_09330 [Acidobacteria bacterium]|nr:MAG: hypothetical protein CR997_09330 [Acidobacteriota bacterium]
MFLLLEFLESDFQVSLRVLIIGVLFEIRDEVLNSRFQFLIVELHETRIKFRDRLGMGVLGT